MISIASVVLNYNSHEELFALIPQLYCQTGINNCLIIVDNASEEDSVQKTEKWLADRYPGYVSGTPSQIYSWIRERSDICKRDKQVLFIKNHKNSGYSAGNNVGLTAANLLESDYAVIANPDVIVDKSDTYINLANVLQDNQACLAVGPAILDENGLNQSPMYEPSLMEELMIPHIGTRYKNVYATYMQKKQTGLVETVDKIHGCFFMLNLSKFNKIGLFDENMFLYCEESAIASKAQLNKFDILYTSKYSVFHFRGKKSKGNVSAYLKSRMYFNKKYRGANSLIYLGLAFNSFLIFAKSKLNLK